MTIDQNTKYHVYVVEDYVDLLEAYSQQLLSFGYDVTSFEKSDDAQAALTHATHNGQHIDLILLDIQLETSKLSCEDFLAIIRKKRPKPQVIVMSGHTSVADFAPYLIHGADNYLLKPFNMKQLHNIVEKHLALGRARYEYYYHPWKSIQRLHRDAFISYSTINHNWVLAITRYLENNGINVWHADLDLHAGDFWPEEIEKALEECPIFIIFMSRDALNSDPVNIEIAKAMNRKRIETQRYHIIPLLYNIKAQELPLELRNIHSIDFSNLDMFADNLQQIIISMNKFLKSRSSIESIPVMKPNIDRLPQHDQH